MSGDDRPPGDERPSDDSIEERHGERGNSGGKAGDHAKETAARKPLLEQVVLPLAEEQIRVDRQQVETGRVRISTKVGIRREDVVVELTKDEVEVRRVPVGREVDGPVEVRREGDVTIIPVLEEVVEVSKRLILREEVHVRRRSHRRSETHPVDLRYEEPLVERVSPDRDEKE